MGLPRTSTSRSYRSPSLSATRKDRTFPSWISEMSRVRPRCRSAQSRSARAASVAYPLPQCSRARHQPSSVSEPPISHVSGSQRRKPARPRTRRVLPRSTDEHAHAPRVPALEPAAIASSTPRESSWSSVADVAHRLRVGERHEEPGRVLGARLPQQESLRLDHGCTHTRCGPWPGSSTVCSGRRAEPLRDPLRADVLRRDQRDDARRLQPLADGEGRLGGVAVSPVLAARAPSRARARRLRTAATSRRRSSWRRPAR